VQLDLKSRIEKDIETFYKNLNTLSTKNFNSEYKNIVELAEMYAKDSQSYLEKGDLVTAFSCISYAHGLLDAVRRFIGRD